MAANNACETVVLVPGLFSPRLTMLPMARRLEKQGYETRYFSNRYLLKSPVQNAQRLLQLLRGINTETVHLVGHSLGGVVIMYALDLNAKAQAADRVASGKVVLIASPVRGNELARKLNAKRGLRWILGRSVEDGLLGPAPENLDGRDTAVISGSSARGLCALLYKPAETNDGVVTHKETMLEQAKDTVCIPQSHALMLFSKLSSELTLQFLQRGKFLAK